MQVLDDSQLLLADTDVFAEEQQARQDQLDALLNKLAPPQELQAQDDGDDVDDDSGDAVFAVDHPAAPADLAALQSFLASDAAPQDKIEQLVNFLADGPAVDVFADEFAADGPTVDVFADEQTQQEQKLKDLVDSLAANKNGNSATATALLATDADDVDVANTQNSFLSVIGGAVVLLVAVVLAVATRRSRSKHEKADDENKDFGYSILYE